MRTRSRIIPTLTAVLATAAVAPAAGMASAGPGERTPTELGQAVAEPGEQSSATALYSRTPTELGQRVAPSAAPPVDASGFDSGDAAIGAGVVVALGLITLGGVALASRRTRGGRASRAPAVSS